MDSLKGNLQLFVRRFGLLNASCCESCCDQQVSLVQSHILFEIRRAANPSMVQVADELGIDLTTFSRQVKTLEGKKLVVRQVSAEDRRVNLLSLTAEGKQVLTRIDQYMATKIEQIFAFMSPFERDSVVRSLDLLNEAIAKAGGCCPTPVDKIAFCK